jgi:hypothetical protein
MRSAVPTILGFAVCTVLLAAASGAAQTTATVQVYVQTDGTVELYLNGVPVGLSAGVGTADVHTGTNVLAVRVVNGGRGLGLACAVVLPDGATVVTDTTWRCSERAPSGSWTTVGFADAQWFPVADIAAVTASGPVELVEHGARLVSAPRTEYYRREFMLDCGPQPCGNLPGYVGVRGSDASVHVYYDGDLVGEATLGFDGGSATWPVTVAEAAHGVGIEVVRTSGAEALPVKAAVLWGPPHDTLGTDWSWRVAVGQVHSEWMFVGFDEDLWPHAAQFSALDTVDDAMASAEWIGVGELYYRRTFEWDGSGALPRVHRSNPTTAPCQAAYYTPTGRRAGEPSRSSASSVWFTALPNGMATAECLLR